MTKKIANLDEKLLDALNKDSEIDEEKILKLLEQGANPNVKDFLGYYPLHEAALQGKTKIVLTLIEKGADVNVIVEGRGNPFYFANKETPLHFACNAEIAELLIKKGANVNAKASDERTPLHSAALKGKIGVVLMLLKHGADLYAKTSDERTPLHFAAFNENQKIVITLLDHGADLHAKTSLGATPLHFAAENGNKEVILTFLEHGADLNAKTNNDLTPIHFAILNGNQDAVLTLLERGANLNARSQSELTLFDCLITQASSFKNIFKLDNDLKPLIQEEIFCYAKKYDKEDILPSEFIMNFTEAEDGIFLNSYTGLSFNCSHEVNA